jgi:TolA-binding protein
MWITEITNAGSRNVQIKGYSLYRTRIASFSQALGAATLKMVETSEIREKTVYHFQLTCIVPYKDKYANQKVIDAEIKRRMAQREKEKQEKKRKENIAKKPQITSKKVVAAKTENKTKPENKTETVAVSKPVNNKKQVETKKNVVASKPANNRKQVETKKNVVASKPAGNKKRVVTIKNEQEFQTKYEQARQLFASYKYKDAIKIFSELIDSGFNSKLLVNCYYWRGESYFGIKDYDNAIENFKYVVRRQSAKKSSSIYMIGRVYAAKGDYKTSEFYMNQVINNYPNEPLARKASDFKRKLR